MVTFLMASPFTHFILRKVSIESGRRELGGNNFMTKDVAIGDWTFHLNKYQTHENTGALK